MPVLLRSGGITWVAWGSRKKEANRDFPSGGWARLDSIEAYKWKPRHPGPVLIIVDQFMEKDKDDRSHWIELDKKMAIQGLLVERKEVQQVCVVTVGTPPEYAWIPDRWPRLEPLKGFKKACQ